MAPPPRRKCKRIHIDLEDGYNDYAVLKCPVCGFEYNHLTGVEVRGGIGRREGIGTRIDATGTRIFGTCVDRGVAVDLEFSGECGHDFTYTLEFHKGQMQVSQREMPGTLKSAIWRD
ncbi:MAG: hypothetical protein FWH27_06590 [Planctomycetaceae bacterium]|nr:hypothetical protein [Planctomycetaceae bacterium]